MRVSLVENISRSSAKFPVRSLFLLLVAYSSFGWFLSDPRFSQFVWFIAMGWIWVISEAFMDPLTSITRFVTRWFKSDTVAFLAICMFAGLATLVLFWMHIFLYILTILATEALAKIEIQSRGFGRRIMFWSLTGVSLLGLGLGWITRFIVTHPELSGLVKRLLEQM